MDHNLRIQNIVSELMVTYELQAPLKYWYLLSQN